MKCLWNLCASALFLAGIGLAQGCAAPPHPAYEFNDPAVPVAVPVGQVFSIRLVTNRNAGYEWKLIPPLDSGRIAVVQTQYTKPATEFSASTGYMVWTFRALAPGDATLTLAYARAWEPTPAETATFNVMIR